MVQRRSTPLDGHWVRWFTVALAVLVVAASQRAGASIADVQAAVMASEKKLAPNFGIAGDRFGTAVATQNDVAVIGAPNSGISGVRSGAVYIFSRPHPGPFPQDRSWQRVAAFYGEEEGDEFGASVALDGDVLVVGAPGANLDDDDDHEGGAYVFRLSSFGWLKETELAGDEITSRRFGAAVAVQNQTVVVGAPQTQLPDSPDTGAVHVFAFDGGWQRQAQLSVSGGNTFGSSVAVAGDTIAVGNPQGEQGLGAVYVFHRESISWGLPIKLLSGHPDLLRFGRQLALHNDVLLVGALSDPALVFRFDGTSWALEQELSDLNPAPSALFGFSLALIDDVAVIATIEVVINGGNVEFFGSASLFRHTAEGWLSNWSFSPEQPGPNFFAASVAIAEGPFPGYETVLSGAPNLDQNSEGTASAFDGISSFFGTPAVFRARLENPGSFGAAVAIAHDSALVGAYLSDTDQYSDVGAAYTFARSAHGWGQTASLNASDGRSDHHFGRSVALLDSTAVIGAARATVNGLIEHGAVYRFDPFGQTKIVASDGKLGDFFGAAVAYFGFTVVGAPGVQQDRGAAYGYGCSGERKMLAADGVANDALGTSVAIASTEALVGAPGASEQQIRGGAVYTFDICSGEQLDKLIASDAADTDFFGSAIAMIGNVLVVGAPFADVAGHVDQGAVYVFARTDGGWHEQAKLVAAAATAGDNFGSALALKNDVLLIGSPARIRVHVFAKNGSDWNELFTITPSDGPNDFGSAVAIYGEQMIVGAPFASSAYVYDLVLATETPTPTHTPSATPTHTPTGSVTHTPTMTATRTPTADGSATPAAVQVVLRNGVSLMANPTPGYGCVSSFLTAGPHVAAVTATIQFDAAKFAFEQCEIEPDIGPGTPTNKSLTQTPLAPGSLQISVSGGIAEIPTTQDLWSCGFRTLNGAAIGQYPITVAVNAADANGAAVPAFSNPGQIRVTNCNGDCDGTGVVEIGEVVRALNEFGGRSFCFPEQPALACPVADSSLDGQLQIGEVVQSLLHFGQGCPSPNPPITAKSR